MQIDTKKLSPSSWTCPHCQRATTTSGNDPKFYNHILEENVDGSLTIVNTFIVCPNPSCKKYTLTAELYQMSIRDYGYKSLNDRLNVWQLIPQSNAKILPEYIPEAIINDYEEACLIQNLSPKASATLARRCLQGMIRDFWNVSKNTLFQEIQAIEDKVNEETWEAIDSVRQIGNIGAHMEKDIDLIIDVEPEEAGALLELIEMLVDEWYVNREETKKRTNRIKEIAEKKAEQKKNGTSPT